MTTERKRFSISLDDDILKAVDQYQHENQIQYRSDALMELAMLGINKTKIEPDIKNYHDLDDHGKRIVDLVIKEELQRMEEAVKKPNTVRIDFFDLPASAGFGLPLESEYKTIIEAPYSDKAAEADFAIRVFGDSMEPTFFDGDIALVRKTEISIGDIGIFVINGESYIKEKGDGILISHNKKYENIFLNGNESQLSVGKVIGKL